MASELQKNQHLGKKVALGMSGGVDSSLCAHLLLEQGYEVTGIYLECWKAPGCRSEEDRKDALKIALDLGIPFKVLDFKDAYKNKVVEYFFEEYQKGLTPNPDVMCNKEIKFGLFYDWAIAEGFDYVATGHYAKNIDANLCVPKDEHKDQTYFLYLINNNQLEHTLFPLQNFTKPDVRKEAEKRGLFVAQKKDSVGICFIGDINVHNFLKERLGEKHGDIIDTAGNIIGKHKGLWFYTIGQRSGFNIDAKTVIKQDDGTVIDKHNIPPFYVIKKIAEKNQLVVGFGDETLCGEFLVKDLHWINDSYQAKNDENLKVRIRHTGELLDCEFDLHNNKVILKKKVQGVAEGQAAVFYKNIKINGQDELVCLGGGVIKH